MQIDFEKLWVENPSSRVLFFECYLSENEQRKAAILGFDFQLWYRPNRSSGEARYISELHLDKRPEVPTDFQFGQKRLLRLVWPYTMEQIEDIDNPEEDKPTFEIRGRLLAQSTYPAVQNLPGRSYLRWEDFYNPQSSSNVIFAEIERTQWAALLNKLGFRPRVLREVSLLTTPGFRRAAECVRAAWSAHRVNDPDKALDLCFKAFESLGFNLFGTADLNRGDLLKKILSVSDPAVLALLAELLKSFQNFLHLGRHEKGHPVRLSEAESRLAILNTEIFLSYLEGYFKTQHGQP